MTPEPTEVALKCSVELCPYRGGDPVWRQELHDVVATDVLAPTGKVWNLPAPTVEGTYILEVRTSWEPLASLGRQSTGALASPAEKSGDGDLGGPAGGLTVVGPQPAKWDAASGSGRAGGRDDRPGSAP